MSGVEANNNSTSCLDQMSDWINNTASDVKNYFTENHTLLLITTLALLAIGVISAIFASPAVAYSLGVSSRVFGFIGGITLFAGILGAILLIAINCFDQKNKETQPQATTPQTDRRPPHDRAPERAPGHDIPYPIPPMGSPRATISAATTLAAASSQVGTTPQRSIPVVVATPLAPEPSAIAGLSSGDVDLYRRYMPEEDLPGLLQAFVESGGILRVISMSQFQQDGIYDTAQKRIYPASMNGHTAEDLFAQLFEKYGKDRVQRPHAVFQGTAPFSDEELDANAWQYQPPKEIQSSSLALFGESGMFGVVKRTLEDLKNKVEGEDQTKVITLCSLLDDAVSFLDRSVDEDPTHTPEKLAEIDGIDLSNGTNRADAERYGKLWFIAGLVNLFDTTGAHKEGIDFQIAIALRKALTENIDKHFYRKLVKDGGTIVTFPDAQYGLMYKLYEAAQEIDQENPNLENVTIIVIDEQQGRTSKQVEGKRA